MSQPVLRASLLLLLALGGKLLNRPRIGLHLLCAAGMVMLLLSPVQLTGQYVEDTLYLTNGLLDGSLQGEPASMPWNNGEMKYAKIGRGQMVSYCYNPENL